jgi:hypothetical protein
VSGCCGAVRLARWRSGTHADLQLQCVGRRFEGESLTVAVRNAVLFAVLIMLSAVGCGPPAALGSNVLWTALFEDGTFSEFMSVDGGSANANPSAADTIVVSNAYAHHGHYAAVLTIDAGPDGVQQNAGLVRRGGLPVEAYYSAWYYLPQTITVGTFWILFKFRLRTTANVENEFYDLELVNAADGSLTFSLYDHQSGMNVPLVSPAPVVPVSVWFQIEAFYRNAQDNSGRLTIWFNGQQIVDVSGQPMAPTPWVEWDVDNVGENLTPSTAVVVVDDCAISLSRVGPTGIIAE